jgi:hypothetical protein
MKAVGTTDGPSVEVIAVGSLLGDSLVLYAEGFKFGYIVGWVKGISVDIFVVEETIVGYCDGVITGVKED